MVSCVDRSAGVAAFVSHEGIADAKTQMVVDEIAVVLVALVDEMILPQRVDEEGLHDFLRAAGDGIDGVHQVGIVHHHLRRFLGKLLSGIVDEVDQSGVGKVFDIVHHCGAAGVDLVGEFTDIGCLRPIEGQKIEELLDLGEVFQFYLLDEQDVHFRHHVHGLEQILQEVSVFKEEGIEAMMEIILKEGRGIHSLDNVFCDRLVVAHDLVQGMWRKVSMGLEVEIFPKGEPTKVVAFHHAIELRILFFEPHDAGSGENDLQLGIFVVALAQLATPVGLLKHLVDEQHLTTLTDKFSGKVGDATPLEIEVVHVDIQTFMVVATEMLFGVLQQERRLSHTSCALNANEPVGPVNLVHKDASNRGIGVVHQVGMCAKEGFHICL